MKKTHTIALVVVLLALPFVAAASGDEVRLGWSYDPGVGLEGRAYAIGEGGMRIEVECGNGGSPAITLVSPMLSRPALGLGSNMTTMMFEIDGRDFVETFECHPGGTSCGSFGFPSKSLITALRRGSRLILRHDGRPLSEVSLVGSNAAISRLSACLE